MILHFGAGRGGGGKCWASGALGASVCVAATEHRTNGETSGNVGIKAQVTQQRSLACSNASLSRTVTFPNPSVFGVKPIL